MALGIDTFSTFGSGQGSAVSGAITTSGSNLLIAMIGQGFNVGSTVSTVTGGGLTWHLGKRSNTGSTGSLNGSAEIWYTKGSLTAQSVTATSSSSFAGVGIVVISLTGFATGGVDGANAIGTVAAGASTTASAPSSTLTTSTNNSLVFAAVAVYNIGTAFTIGSNQTMIGSGAATGAASIKTDVAGQRQTSITPTSGTVVTMNDTAPTAGGWDMAMLEVLPAVAAAALPNQIISINQSVKRGAFY